ncbi:MAG: hypothetical protein ACI8S6_004605 [Myxococcota bacterium]|jgi:hypothetical protein
MSRSARDWRHGPLSRRALLRGVGRTGLVAVALPPLHAMFNTSGTAYACDGILPRRFGLWFWGNGNLPERWTPEQTGSGDEWALSDQLAPLASVKDYLCLVTGMACKVPNVSPHGSGAGAILSAASLQATGDDETFAAPSIDQVIAAEIGSAAIYRSVQTAASSASGRSYNGPNSLNPAESDPYAVYARLFGDTFIEPGEDGVVDPRLGLRRSALDLVMGDIDALNARLGAEDRARLDQHLTGVRELEQRLARLEEDPPNLESCDRPAQPSGDYGDIDGRAQVRERNRVMSELLAMAMACDQTRVFAHTISDPVSDVLWPDAPNGHHDLTHNEGGDQPSVHDITVQIMECLADTLEILAAVPEGDGVLLDNCAIFATSEVSLGQTHSIEEMPIIIAGSCCGFFEQNVHYRSLSADNATKVLVSLQRAFDIDPGTFGTEDAATDSYLSEIEA